MVAAGNIRSAAVLVLNQNYEPLNVCNARRAFGLVDRGKAEVLELDRGAIRSVSFTFFIPSVIRLIYLIRRPRSPRRLSRREIFLRDRYTCQYCGREARDLTVDHVLPRHRGGRQVWYNLVSACKACNHRKAGRTPEEARMKLLQEPKAPPAAGSPFVYPHLTSRQEWRKFIPEWELQHLRLSAV